VYSAALAVQGGAQPDRGDTDLECQITPGNYGILDEILVMGGPL